MTPPPVVELLSHLTGKQRSRSGLILKSILESRKTTRAELSELLGMSSSSVSKYVATLLDVGFVREGENRGGRSPVLELDPSGGVNITVVLDLNTIHGALVSLRGDVVESVDVPIVYGIPGEVLLQRLLAAIETLKRHAEERRRSLFGIGIGMGGALDQRSGISYGYRYAADWGVMPIKKIVEEEFGVPCFVLHDTNAVVAGEKYFGFGVGVDTFMTVWVSDGVSLGALINGEVYLGNDGFLGEFGHIQAVESGPLCYCGHTGCLETVTKENYIIEKVLAGLRSGVHSEVSPAGGAAATGVCIKDVKAAANHGDRFCKMIFEEVAVHLGNKLSDIINVLNPGLVTFRGSVIDGNDFLFENIYRIIHNRSVRNISNSIQLKYARTEEEIRMKGLGSWILANYFAGHR